jgi:hypothetical protein
MLTLPEKILFLIALSASLYAAFRVTDRIAKIIRRGQGQVDWTLARVRLWRVLKKTLTLRPTFRMRIVPSLFHAFVAWAFIYYLLVNLIDGLEGLFTDLSIYELIGPLGGPFSLVADLLSVAALLGMSALLIRRYLLKPSDLSTRQDILLHPNARSGIRRDSAIVGVFILVHVGSRFLGQSFVIALGGPDPWQPFASAVANFCICLSGWLSAPSWHLSPTSCIPNTSTCSSRRSTFY